MPSPAHPAEGENTGGALGRRQYLIYEVLTQRPASHLNQWPDGQDPGVATERLVLKEMHAPHPLPDLLPVKDGEKEAGHNAGDPLSPS